MSGSGAGASRTSWRAGSWAARRLRAGSAGRARQAGLNGRGAAGRAGARGRQARGARQARWARPAWAWPGRSLCARAGPVGPGWGFVHSDSVFFGPVRLGSFLSHQMNTIHGEIKFFEKTIYILKKLNKNQIKSNKILIKFSKNIIFKNKIFENKISLKTLF